MKLRPSSVTTPLARWLAPLTKLTTELGLEAIPTTQALPILMEANVQTQVSNVADTDIIHEAWEVGKASESPFPSLLFFSEMEPVKLTCFTCLIVYVHGWVYEIEHGRLRDLDISVGPPKH